MYTKSYTDADDITHDTFIAIWNNAGKYREINPQAWIMTIARNISLKYIESKKKLCNYDDVYSSDDFRETIEKSDMINKMLTFLGDTEREIVMLYSRGFSHLEISEITGINYATVRWKYRNAIKKLSRLFGDESLKTLRLLLLRLSLFLYKPHMLPNIHVLNIPPALKVYILSLLLMLSVQSHTAKIIRSVLFRNIPLLCVQLLHV